MEAKTVGSSAALPLVGSRRRGCTWSTCEGHSLGVIDGCIDYNDLVLFEKHTNTSMKEFLSPSDLNWFANAGLLVTHFPAYARTTSWALVEASHQASGTVGRQSVCLVRATVLSPVRYKTQPVLKSMAAACRLMFT